MSTVKFNAVTELPLTDIILDAGTQFRVDGINPDVVRHYADLLRDGYTGFPPIEVWLTEVGYVLVNGFHRWHAFLEAGYDTIPVNIKKGSLENAILAALEANSDNPYPLSRRDIVGRLYFVFGHPRWSQKPLNWIAKRLTVSWATVRKYHQKWQVERGLVVPEGPRPGTTDRLPSPEIGQTSFPADEPNRSTETTVVPAPLAPVMPTPTLSASAYADHLRSKGLSVRTNVKTGEEGYVADIVVDGPEGAVYCVVDHLAPWGVHNVVGRVILTRLLINSTLRPTIVCFSIAKMPALLHAVRCAGVHVVLWKGGESS